MGENGRLAAGELTAIPGGRLRADAAVAWLAMRRYIGNEKGIWICPTSMRTSYRCYADQQYFWNLYRAGKGALAARPGTSNHGWGLAVDIPTPAMQAAVRECGHRFGWGIRGGKLASDAPSEPWHATFHPGVYTPPAKPKPVHPYQYMRDCEQAARDTLIKERRVARRNGGWDHVERRHRERAAQAKAELNRYARDIAVAARSTGWDKMHRKARFDYINKLTGV